MKSLTFAMVLSLSLAVAFAGPLEDAKKECKASNAVKRDPFDVIEKSYENGEEVQLTKEEQCYVKCVSQKVKLLDENASLVPETYVSHTLKKYSQLEKYKSILLSNANIIVKATKNYKNLCGKAFMSSLLSVHQVVVLLGAK